MQLWHFERALGAQIQGLVRRGVCRSYDHLCVRVCQCLVYPRPFHAILNGFNRLLDVELCPYEFPLLSSQVVELFFDFGLQLELVA